MAYCPKGHEKLHYDVIKWSDAHLLICCLTMQVKIDNELVQSGDLQAELDLPPAMIEVSGP